MKAKNDAIDPSEEAFCGLISVVLINSHLIGSAGSTKSNGMENPMKKFLLILGLALLALPILVLAQEKTESATEPSLLERVQKAAALIKTSEEAREAGIPEEDVAEVLESARDNGLSPQETEAVLTETTEVIKETGPVDNFGAFVQSKLDEGLRGKDLADAIHEEHRHHGKGKGHGKQKGKKEEHKGHKHDHEGRHADSDDDDDDDDKNGDAGQGHGKGAKKEKGKK